jgi:hypothetical protein
MASVLVPVTRKGEEVALVLKVKGVAVRLKTSLAGV